MRGGKAFFHTCVLMVTFVEGRHYIKKTGVIILNMQEFQVASKKA